MALDGLLCLLPELRPSATGTALVILLIMSANLSCQSLAQLSPAQMSGTCSRIVWDLKDMLGL